MRPVPQRIGQVRTTITRAKSGLNRLWPKYMLNLSEGDKKFLLAAKKRSGNTSNYVIATDEDKMEKSPGGYLGKVRSNFLGTEFLIEDTGVDYRGGKSEPGEQKA